MKTVFGCSVLCVLVWCASANSKLDDASNLQHVVSAILRRLDEKDAQIKELQQLNAEQNNRLADQTAIIEKLQQRLRKLESKSDPPAEAMEAAIKSLSTNDRASSFKQEDSGNGRKSQHGIRQAMTETPVAFFATLTSHITHAGRNQTIAFDRVLTNVGNAYNAHVGLFTAPVSGIYVFSVSLLSMPGHATHYSLYKNSDFISIIFLHAASAGHYESTSQTAVLQLTKGDDVTLRNYDNDESLYGGNYSTFAGFLVWEDFNQPAVVGK